MDFLDEIGWEGDDDEEEEEEGWTFAGLSTFNGSVVVVVVGLVPFIVSKASYGFSKLSFDNGESVLDIVAFLMKSSRTKGMF